jgi:hypothetical protein
MLTWISKKFSQRLTEPIHEPRAALFVNRFTRTATIMYATNGVSDILGLHPTALISQSFYYCIQEECLGEAVRCLEGAKANDSIAYLRFLFRNPLQNAIAESPIELEAVVSCTSDGLVVILRRARAPIPTAAPTLPSTPMPTPQSHTSGIFAAPWAPEPVFSYGAPRADRTTFCREGLAQPEVNTTLCQEGSSSDSGYASQKQETVGGPGKTGPHSHRLMDTIRDVAVFAWGIVGINRSLEQYKCGTPTGNAHPGDEMDMNMDVDVKQEPE